MPPVRACTSSQVLLLAYPFLWLQLYSFLFRQRRKKLGSKGSKAA